MYRFVENMIKMYGSGRRHREAETCTPLPVSVDELKSKLRSDFGDSADLTIRELVIDGKKVAVITIDNMTDKR